MTDRQEALDPLRTLKVRLQELADKLNIELNNVAFMPGTKNGDPDIAQVVFMLTPEALMDAAELDQKRTDDEFNRMMSSLDIEGKDAATLAEDPTEGLWDEDE